jgi:hypothetical protein
VLSDDLTQQQVDYFATPEGFANVANGKIDVSKMINDNMQRKSLKEKLGDNRPKLGSKRDAGKSVRKWRKTRGLDETGVSEGSLDEVLNTKPSQVNKANWKNSGDDITSLNFTVSNGIPYQLSFTDMYMAPEYVNQWDFIPDDTPDQISDNGKFVEFVQEKEQGDGHGKQGIEGTGAAAEVFGIVYNAIIEFVQKYKPIYLMFQAAEPSRIRLYSTLVRKMLQTMPGWATQQKGGVFFVYNKKYFKQGVAEGLFGNKKPVEPFEFYLDGCDPHAVKKYLLNKFGSQGWRVAGPGAGTSRVFVAMSPGLYPTGNEAKWDIESNCGQQGMAEGLDKPVHRIGLTVTDPNHPMVSKRGETIQKTVRVPGHDPAKAITAAIAHHRRKGYKVHDHHYMGTVDDEPMDEGKQQKGADYRDPPETDYDATGHDASVARLKHLAGVGPMKTVYDPAKRVYKNMPTAQQPKRS